MAFESIAFLDEQVTWKHLPRYYIFVSKIVALCLTNSVIYKAEVTSTDHNARQTDIGVTDNEFKTR